MRYSLFPLVLIAFLPAELLAQSNTVVTKITSPVQALSPKVFLQVNAEGQQTAIDLTAEPYKSGKLTRDFAQKVLKNIGCKDDQKDPATCYTSITTIIHILRWQDSAHTKTAFDRWYIYDPKPPLSSFYLPTSAEFTGTSIPGRTTFQLVYFHLNHCLTTDSECKAVGGDGEWAAPQNGDNPPTLLHPVSYSVTVAKAQTQFLQDLKSILQITGAINTASKEPLSDVGYYSIGNFSSQWTTSTITVNASLDSGDNNKATSANDKSTQLVSQVFTNEKPTWVGLSGGVQITSYKDVTYQSSGGTLSPASVTSKNVYLFLDGYVPAVIPGLVTFRWIPHPTFGMPVKGKVLRHTMLGGAIGLKLCEPYGGVVFDTENAQVKGSSNSSTNSTSLTIQPVFGLKISISAVAKALKGKS